MPARDYAAVKRALIKNLRKLRASPKLRENYYMAIAGITGGMGCGKSTAAGLFERRGFRRIDSDALVREVVLTAPEVVTSLKARFGASIIGHDGEVDRPALGRRVFANDADRLWLEELTHPLVYKQWREAFAAKPTTNWIVEVPLLFEKGLENWFDFTVCVACAAEEELARLERPALPRVLAGQRISKQLAVRRKI